MNEQNKKLCAICNTELKDGEATTTCPKCNAEYHTACWESNGGCPNPDCKETENKVCANCGAELAEGQSFCPRCGTGVTPNVPAPRICTACGAELQDGSDFCAKCGKRVNSFEMTEAKPKSQKKKTPLFIGIGAAVAVVVIAILLIVFRKVPVDALVLDKNELEIVEKETYTVSCTVYPTNATDKSVEWTSSDEDVATVNEVGLITAVAEGECTVKATSGEKSVEMTVTVKKDVPDFKAIYDEYCTSTWAEVGSDGSYLEIDTNPYNRDDYWDSDADAAIEKINSALGLPDSINSDIGNTSWSMGKQSETFESIGITVEWTYHPDKGTEITYKLINK